MISIGIHVSADIRMGRRIILCQRVWHDPILRFVIILSIIISWILAIFVFIWLDSERWEHCSGTWNNNAARALAVWKCKLIGGLIDCQCDFSINLSVSCLNTARVTVSKIRQQHLSNRSVCVCRRPWFLDWLKGTHGRKRTSDYARTWGWEAWLNKISWLYC